mmetsp:Transcript_27013/g.62238  ORF Transcript_27013/g.62238 Transcript_27013/m.62238 type:complete len:238 (+) Transcript_27013:1366-2079(+)
MHAVTLFSLLENEGLLLEVGLEVHHPAYSVLCRLGDLRNGLQKPKCVQAPTKGRHLAWGAIPWPHTEDGSKFRRENTLRIRRHPILDLGKNVFTLADHVVFTHTLYSASVDSFLLNNWFREYCGTTGPTLAELGRSGLGDSSLDDFFWLHRLVLMSFLLEIRQDFLFLLAHERKVCGSLGCEFLKLAPFHLCPLFCGHSRPFSTFSPGPVVRHALSPQVCSSLEVCGRKLDSVSLYG